jgi:signal transduction histidine kinase
MGRALLAARDEVGSTNACLHTQSTDGKRILCQAVTSGFRPTRLAHGLDLTDCPAVADVLHTGKAIAIDDATADPRVARVARERYGIRSVLYQPVGDAAVVIFCHQEPHAWTAAEHASAHLAAEELGRILSLRQENGDERSGPSDARLRAMLDVSAGIVAAIDRDFVVYEASVPCGFDLGVTELLREIRSGPRAVEVESALRELFARERSDYEAVLILESGPTEIRLRAHPPGDGPLEGVLVAAHALADSNAAVSLLRREERNIALGRISARVAHEFNNLLQIVANATDTMRETDPRRGAGNVQLESIEQAVARGARLAKQLLAFAKPTPAARAPVRLDRVIEGMRSLLESSVGQEHVILFGGRSGGFVQVDLEQLRLAVVNLCLNARDASPAGTRVDVTVADGTMSDGRACSTLEVTDRGNGMTREVLARAFEPFFSTKPEGHGTGLGLPMVRSFVDAHGGEIHIDTAPGEGVRFRIDLPQMPALTTTDEARRTGRVTGARVLAVEDEAEIGNWLQRVLTVEGAEVTLVRTVAAALAFLQNALPDVVVLDMTLPDGHGTAVLEALEGRLSPERVVIASGYAGVDRPAIVQAGHRWLEKPYGRAQLVEVVAQATGAGTG